jgi:hypothetical protein
MVPGIPIMDESLQSKGDIWVADGACIGYGVTVLQEASMGAGAVIASARLWCTIIPKTLTLAACTQGFSSFAVI